MLRNQKLIIVLSVTLLIHALGFYVLAQFRWFSEPAPKQVQFEEVTITLEKKETPKQEVKMEVKQKPAPQMNMSQSQVSQKNINISLPKISVSVPNMQNKVFLSGMSKSVSKVNTQSFGKGPKFNKPSHAFGGKKKLKHAFMGTLYTFDRIEALKVGDELLVGTNKKKRANRLYTYSLSIPSQDFTKGFPGITDQNEWFAFDFVADIEWPKYMEGVYEFQLASDDGSIFMINNEVVINNDGHHGMIYKKASRMMKAGKYKFRVLYFQGAATKLGLVFNYRAQGEAQFEPFYTKKFEPMDFSPLLVKN